MSNYCKAALLSAFMMMVACSDEPVSAPVFTVEKKPLVVTMQAFGEVEAAQAQRVMTPGRQPMTIEWLAPENSEVKKGDVIARFDGERIMMDSREEQLEMQMIEQDIAQSLAAQNKQVNEILSEQGFVSHEFDFVDRFAIDDVRVYSKLEIIETLQNRDFLQAKDTFLDWKEGSVVEQNASEMAVLDIKRDSHEVKYKRHQEALSQLQVYAPNDGLITYEKDRRGEKPSVGQTVFPGRPIAQIPNLDEMQATAYVLSRDAIGLVTGLPVAFSLDAFPQTPLTGYVKEVAGFPRSIERGSPVTYYEVVFAFDQQRPDLMKPGSKLSATITSQLKETALQIPLQALSHDLQASYVYVKTLTGWERRTVTTGDKNLFFVEITDGLIEGEEVALSPPEVSV
ncbi:efflux RND transporter periplasmic adaptor subunit [Alteromonas oceanisediminis]|uniref:efflux RND transporter periplasmic adaptor subunit n=1 Tax=Alteromonas oceanisediminis TaxID=2836180 RepID=UPI001BD97216|nr:HlyD family efflux transporter periplasmic adaptor subunit [Alteromonas oceanisediminis]MBT0586229.1 HlyD family efflux transporter periplasmic adaptor subunit [Alteromonas oceanisediminis]